MCCRHEGFRGASKSSGKSNCFEKKLYSSKLKYKSDLVLVQFPCTLTWKSWGLLTSRWRFCALATRWRSEAVRGRDEGVPEAPLWPPSGEEPSPASPPPYQTKRMRWSVFKSDLITAVLPTGIPVSTVVFPSWGSLGSGEELAGGS